MASVFVAHRLSCSLACGIFLDQESIHVPCIGRGILNHWTNRGVFEGESFTYLSLGFWWLLTALSVPWLIEASLHLCPHRYITISVSYPLVFKKPLSLALAFILVQDDLIAT